MAVAAHCSWTIIAAVEAYWRAGIAAPVVRIGTALEQYEDEPDTIIDEIYWRTSPFDLKLDFGNRGALAPFLREYEPLVHSSAAA
jgi:hypothetical protein